MIRLTRLDGTRLLVNVDHIELIEETPDTVLSLSNGHKILARERADEIVDRIVAFRRRVAHPHGSGADTLVATTEILR